MKLIRKCAIALLTLALASSLVISCKEDEPDTPAAPVALKKATFSPVGPFIEESKNTITINTKEKNAEIYYELVADKAVSKLTKENYATVGTKYDSKKKVTVANGDTIYAVVVKGNSVSDIAASKQYGYAIPGPDTDVLSLHSMIMPSGTGTVIPAWTKSDNAYANDLPEVVTSFTDSTDSHVALNGKTNRTQKLIETLDAVNKTNFFDDKEVKNVIVVFSDGWGESHLLGSRQYYNNGVLIADHLPYHAPVNHDCYPKRSSTDEVTWTYDASKNKWWYYKNTENSTVKTTDSTAGGSAINTGFTTFYKSCGVDLKGTEVKNILELAREKGMIVGNVTNDYLTDATPATVSVHSPKRDDDVIIRGRMFIASPDFSMGSGGFGAHVTANSADALAKLWNEYTDESPEDKKTVWDADKNKWVGSETENVTGLMNQWYDANLPTLKKWAISMLNEYDGKNLTGDEYDFADWSSDRKMSKQTTLAKAIQAVEADVHARPLVSFSVSNVFKYTPGNFDSRTGVYESAPAYGYKLGYGKANGEEVFPNYAEMVASTLYILDKKAKAEDRGFFAFIENTCPDGWGHKNKQYDIINENQLSDEGIAIAVKYVLENPDTLLVVTADHETGGVQYMKGWETDYKMISSVSDGDHSSQPVPVFAFGAGAKANWGDVPQFDMSTWTADEKAAWVKGDVYPNANNWTDPHEAQATKKTAAGGDFPKILRNHTTGIRIGKAMGYDKFGDLNGNGILDPDTESDSIVSYDKVGTNK